MAKYHKLVEKHQAEIGNIKALRAEYESLIEQVNAIDPVVHPEPDFEALAKLNALEEEAHELYEELYAAWDMLSQDIEAEYYNVPYSKPRQQGIDGFWREAGLETRNRV